MHASLAGVIDRAYRLDLDDESWIAVLLDAARAALDHGLGVFGLTYDASTSPLTIGALVYRGDAPERLAALLRVATTEWSPTRLVQYLTRCGAGGARAHSLENVDAATHSLARTGIADVLPVAGGATADAGVFLAGLLPHRMRQTRHDELVLRRVERHLAAGYRLRRTLPANRARVAAWLSGRSNPETSVASAAALRRASMDEAPVLLRALLAGRWALVDCFDQDGRRFLIARPREPLANDPQALSAREREVIRLAASGQPLKLIGYELGIAPSTVATHLDHAMRKLGFGSRTELIRYLPRIASESTPGSSFEAAPGRSRVKDV